MLRRSLVTAGVLGLAAMCFPLGCGPDATMPSDTGPISLLVISGDGQSGIVGTELPQPLVIKATNGKGVALHGVTVNFLVTSGGGTMFAGTVSTDNKGSAEDYWTLGTSTAQAQRVEVRAVLPDGQKQVFGVFSATPLPGPASHIATSAGDDQIALVNTAVAIPPSVILRDQFNNPVPVAGVPVTFVVGAGGGSLTGGAQLTDAAGIATVGSWTLGPALLPNTLTATSATLSGSSVTFTATGIVTEPLYITNSAANRVTGYAAGANGNALPVATIEGTNTRLEGPQGIALDSAGNIYVVNHNSITIYRAGADGNEPPTTAFGGVSAGLDMPQGIALDGTGNIYVTNTGANSITVYDPTAKGGPLLIATIKGNNTGLRQPAGIATDGAGNIYVADQSDRSVRVYGAGARGNTNALPVTTIAGSSTGLDMPQGIALDGAGNIYVTNPPTNSITVYAAGSSGNAPPNGLLVGSSTALDRPQGIAVDGAGNIYVVNNNSITIYAAGANGNAKPIVTIMGGNTGINHPLFVALPKH